MLIDVMLIKKTCYSLVRKESAMGKWYAIAFDRKHV